MSQDQGASAKADRAATPSEPSQSSVVSGVAGIPCAFTREDMVDAIATAISDSFDVDWNSRAGAEAVVRNCGVFELYEAGAALIADVRSRYPCEELRCPHMRALDAAIVKARGGQ